MLWISMIIKLKPKLLQLIENFSTSFIDKNADNDFDRPSMERVKIDDSQM